MNRLIKLINFGISFVVSSTLLASNPAETTNVVSAQVEVSKAAIGEVTRNIYEEADLSSFNLGDYKAQVGEFKQNLELALLEFEDKMESQILFRVKELVDHYNGIYNSKLFSEAQKKIILNKQFQEISDEMKELSVAYQNALKTLLASSGDFLYDYWLKTYDLSKASTKAEQVVKKWAKKTKIFNKGRVYYWMLFPLRLSSGIDYTLLKSRSWTYWEERSNGIGGGVLKFNELKEGAPYYQTFVPEYIKKKTRAYPYKEDTDIHDIELMSQKIFYEKEFPYVDLDLLYPEQFKLIAGSCASQLCVSLRGADILQFLTEVAAKLDKKIVLKLVDKKKIVLENLNFSPYLVKYFIERTDFPVELPFDLE